MSETCELDPVAGYALWAANYPPHSHNPFMLAEERAMLGLLPQSLAGRSLLDVGCGSGRYLLHARERGATVCGVDRSAQMLALARTQGLPVVQGSATRVPVTDAWADVVVCALTLGHVFELRSALGELARVLKVSGTLLCSDFHPIADALGWKRTFSHGGARYAVRYTTHRYADWHAASKAAGLQIEEVIEPLLDPADITDEQHFDPRALTVPVAIVLRMSKVSGRPVSR
ncbi:MAG TPA: class I SAM-dependent methyltransferase [Steroidobacteraceae bacterium]|nr:class I SAM-dependent methyltransferase [Steroidobacteraceae bacterium]